VKRVGLNRSNPAPRVASIAVAAAKRQAKSDVATVEAGGVEAVAAIEVVLNNYETRIHNLENPSP